MKLKWLDGLFASTKSRVKAEPVIQDANQILDATSQTPLATPSKSSGLTLLPPELIIQIFAHLPRQHLLSLKLSGNHYITNLIRQHFTFPSLQSFMSALMHGSSTSAANLTLLSRAAAGGHESLVTYLLTYHQTHFVDCSARYPTSVALAGAAEYGQTALVRSLLARDVMGSGVMVFGPAEVVAAYQPLTELDEFVYRAETMAETMAPVYLAVRGGHVGVLVVLLDYLTRRSREVGNLGFGKRIMAATRMKKQSHEEEEQDVAGKWMGGLEAAAGAGNEEMVKVFLRFGVEVDYPYGHSDGKKLEKMFCARKTALFVAAENGHDGIVQLLAENGADIGFVFAGKVTPLMKARENGHADVVATLIRLGAT